MSTWENLKKLATEENLPLPMVATEPLQIAFLDGLYGERESLNVVFHGGTAIRLLHSGYRYSEDLDFCVGPETMKILDDLVRKAYQSAQDLIILYFGNADIELKKKEGRKKIATWWLNVLPPGERQKYKVKIEFGTYPVYSKQVIPIKIKNALLPRQPTVVSISVQELLADKVSALADRPYTKERDFFDVWYLTTALAATLDTNLLRSKFADYRVNSAANLLKSRLKDLNAKNIAQNMERFLPRRYRDLLSLDNYRPIIDACRKVIRETLELL